MKSYALAIALAMLAAAVYAFQNTGEVLVRFLVWELSFPQGIWEVMLFAAGGVLMWLVSLFASMESRSKYVRQVKEKEARIRDLEGEKSTLVEALKYSGERHEAEIRAQRPEEPPGEGLEETEVEVLEPSVERHEAEIRAQRPEESPGEGLEETEVEVLEPSVERHEDEQGALLPGETPEEDATEPEAEKEGQ
ncbi:MAG TPA: LapA family protein [Synergistales bacterium]|mgnify:CR=1 FL=1|nr:LapA family protein [Synergistales bacterium]